MSAEALARIQTANLLAAEAASDKVEAAISNLYDAIEAALDAWFEVQGMDSHIELRELNQAGDALMAVKYER
mgnify:CR=1 FL=1|jgi:hypothetical protein